MRRALASVAAVILLGLVLLTSGCGDDEPTEPILPRWHTEVVDSAGSTGVFTSVALDAAGLPHIVYFNESGPDNLKYSHFEGSVWQISVVDFQAATSLDFGGTSILIDDGGNLHVGYLDINTEEIRYAHELIGGWQIDQVDNASLGLRSPSMAFNRGQTPVFAYGKTDDDTTSGLFVAYLDDGIWERQSVDTGATVISTSVAVDTGGIFHIAYTANEGYPGTDLLYASGSPGTWVIDTVLGESKAGYYCSLDLTSDGLPRIAFISAEPRGIGYAVWSEAGWTVETFDESALGTSPIIPYPEGELVKLALDQGGNPHVAYWSWSDSSLVYAVRGGQWVTERADNDGSVGTYVGLALDNQGRPHVSYQDRNNLDLRYAIKK